MSKGANSMRFSLSVVPRDLPEGLAGLHQQELQGDPQPVTNMGTVALRSLVHTPSMTTSDLSTHSTASLISNEEQFEDYGEGEDVDCAPSSPCPDDETRTNVYSDLGSSVSSRWPLDLGWYLGLRKNDRTNPASSQEIRQTPEMTILPSDLGLRVLPLHPDWEAGVLPPSFHLRKETIS